MVRSDVYFALASVRWDFWGISSPVVVMATSRNWSLL